MFHGIIRPKPRAFGGGGGGGGGGGSGLDAATTAWVNAVVSAGGSVSSPRQTAVDTFIKALKSAGIWNTLDRYHLLAGENLASVKIDLKNTVAATIVGTPSVSASGGIITSLGNNLTIFNPSTDAVNYTLISATHGGFVNTDRVTGSNLFEWGAANGAFTNVASLNAYDASYSSVHINDGSAIGIDKNHGTRGSWINTRTGSAVASYYNNTTSGYPLGGITGTTGSSGLPDVPFAIGALNQAGTISGYTASQISTFFVASGWDSTQTSAFYSAEQALLNSIGVLP